MQGKNDFVQHWITPMAVTAVVRALCGDALIRARLIVCLGKYTVNAGIFVKIAAVGE